MATAERARVVIADDEAIIRLDLKEMLQNAGYEVVGETGRVTKRSRSSGASCPTSPSWT